MKSEKVKKKTLLRPIFSYRTAGMARPGLLGGQEPPKNSLSPPSALDVLKISEHCGHFRNLLVMLLESVVAF